MVARNGPDVEARLRQTTLYDPRLDLAVLAPDGSVAGYSLFWNDPVTGVGLVEPVRVEDEHAGRGIGYAMISAGLDRLARAGRHDVEDRLGVRTRWFCAGLQWEPLSGLQGSRTANGRFCHKPLNTAKWP